jgi:hypothetical protein
MYDISAPSENAEYDKVSDSNSRLFSYVLAYDTGFAPHVFNGICTLATCKPKIRQSARRGDWIIGTSGRRYCDDSNRLVYLMQVTDDPASFEDYDQMFPDRRPSSANPLGDNIYYLNAETGRFEQRANPLHSIEQMEHDLSGQAVLISRRFVYFGKAMPPIPADLDLVKTGPGHRCNFSPLVLQRFFEWTNQLVRDDGWNLSYGEPNE